jgi:hypothetical protein
MSAPRPFSPHTAFGLKAATVALMAKGGRLERGAGLSLDLQRQQLLPDDESARLAVFTFRELVETDAVRAGNFLMSWVTSRDSDAPTDWRARADCGHG